MAGCENCSGCTRPFSGPPVRDEYVVALAGNANVGKSATFNQLTGIDQDIGNWPGKTVERAEGILQHRGQRIRVIDLPGIYSISTLSTEEQVSREFIAQQLQHIHCAFTYCLVRSEQWCLFIKCFASVRNEGRRNAESC